MVTLFGIKNCDTVKKARQWLEQNGVEHQFHDFREDGINSEQVNNWLKELGWQTLINKRSTSWKQLTDNQKNALLSGRDLNVLIEMPTLIKRPVLESKQSLLVGFKEADYLNLAN